MNIADLAKVLRPGCSVFDVDFAVLVPIGPEVYTLPDQAARLVT